jgi:hypothetical protein
LLFIKDPASGKRQARLNPHEKWIYEDVTELQIIEDELWHEVKQRQQKLRKMIIDNGGSERISSASALPALRAA